MENDNREIKIAPSILSADFGNMRHDVKKVQEAGADMIHFDVMDGLAVGVSQITFGTKMVADLKETITVPIDVHLMVARPERMTAAFAQAGANIISFHVETTDKSYIVPLLKDIRRHKCKAGIVISPDTAIPSVKDYLDYCDMVTLMSVRPGASNQEILPEAMDRLQKLKALIGNKNIDIKIDGGINLQNVGLAKEYGANIIVSGSTIFKSQDWADTIKQLRERTSADVDQDSTDEDDDEDENAGSEE